MGDDGVGLLLVEMCVVNLVGQWVVIDGGSVLENDIVVICELCFECLLIVDVIDMGLNFGDICIIDFDDIVEMFMMIIYNMLFNYLVDQLKEDVGEVIFFGIQLDIVGFYYLMIQLVKEVVVWVYQQLVGWKGKGGFIQLEVVDDQFCGELGFLLVYDWLEGSFVFGVVSLRFFIINLLGDIEILICVLIGNFVCFSQLLFKFNVVWWVQCCVFCVLWFLWCFLIYFMVNW